METQNDRSYGVVPLMKEDGVWKVFLIYQFGHGGDIYWTFPKGHAEGEETPREAAERELREETGLEVTELFEEKPYIQSYSFVSNGVLILKEVIFYRGLVENPTFTIQEDEVKNAGWFDLESALGRLTFEGNKEILRQVTKDLQ
jgi:bis(5'-nucleosidyl)-tetraphosphatase